MKDFFVLPEKNILRENILNSGDIITSVIVPSLPKNTSSAYIKVKERGAWDFAIVSIAAVIQNSGTMIQSGKIAFGGVAPIPWLDEKLSSRLKNLPVSKQNLRLLQDDVLTDADPLAQNSYKHTLAKNLTTRILENLTTI
ncbi:MAG: hypothetical protein JSW33_15715 [bacterium]|nr:MAG: hypothetical protein JSW33_15715 [bacterium]